MVSESFTLLRATDLTRVGDGGGVGGGEHRHAPVPLAAIAETIAEHRQRGTAIDVRLLMLMGGALIGS